MIPLSDVRRVIAENYDMDEFSIEAVTKALYRVHPQTGIPSYIFKLHRTLLKENIPILARIYRRAGEARLSPEIIPTRNGEILGRAKKNCFSLQQRLPDQRAKIPGMLLARRLAALHRFLLINASAPIVNHLKKRVPDMMGACRHYGFNHLLPLVAEIDDFCNQEDRQLVHGDLHPGNIIFLEESILFIDFDSAATLPTGMDVAFCAFRCLDGSAPAMARFVRVYNCSNPPSVVDGDLIWKMLVYLILQRILFIRVEQDHGRSQWVSDLVNQQNYLKQVLKFIKCGG